MAYKIRVQAKKNVAEPEQALTLWERTISWVEKHLKGVAWALGGVVLVAAVIGGGFVWKLRYDQRAQLLFEEASRFHEDRLISEKREENLKKASESYRKLLQEYPRSRVAPAAQFSIGNVYLELGLSDEAVAEFEAFLKKYPSGSVFRPLVLQRMAMAHQQKGRTEEAQKLWTQITDLPAALNRDQAYLELARLAEAAGRKEEAIQQYRELTKLYPNSPYAPESIMKVQLLGGSAGEAASSLPPEAMRQLEKIVRETMESTPPQPPAAEPKK
jgi:tetratricopeptide (TPR) repeat protein